MWVDGRGLYGRISGASEGNFLPFRRAIDIPLVIFHQSRIAGGSVREGLHHGKLLLGEVVDIDFREPGDKGGEGNRKPPATRAHGDLVKRHSQWRRTVEQPFGVRLQNRRVTDKLFPLDLEIVPIDNGFVASEGVRDSVETFTQELPDGQLLRTATLEMIFFISN